MSYANFTALSDEFLYPIREQWEAFLDDSSYVTSYENLRIHSELEEMEAALRNGSYNQFVRDVNIWESTFYDWVHSFTSTAEEIIDEAQSALEDAETDEEKDYWQVYIGEASRFQAFFDDFEGQVDELHQDYEQRVNQNRAYFDRQLEELKAEIDKGIPMASIVRENWTEGDYEASATDFREIDSWTLFDEKDTHPVEQAINYLETEGVDYADDDGKWYEQESEQDPYARYLSEHRTFIIMENFDEDELLYIRQQVKPTFEEERARRLAEKEAERRREEMARRWGLEAEERLFENNNDY